MENKNKVGRPKSENPKKVISFRADIDISLYLSKLNKNKSEFINSCIRKAID